MPTCMMKTAGPPEQPGERLQRMWNTAADIWYSPPFSNEERQKEELGFDSSSKAAVQGNGKLLARYDITLEDGCLKEYRRLEDGEQGDKCMVPV